MAEIAAVEEWLRVHRMLIERERQFTDIAIAASTGSVGPEALAAERAQLEALRALCSAAYLKAFPSPSAR